LELHEDVPRTSGKFWESEITDVNEHYISFKKAKIAETFAEIDRVLVREKVIAAASPTGNEP
jgi:hypothetical protein